MNRIVRLSPLFLVFLTVTVAAQTKEIRWNPSPGRYASASVGATLPPGASAEYRFVENGDGIWRPFTGTLDLTAFPREERAYRIQLRAQSGDTRIETEASYVIDRVPPSLPTVSPLPGSYEGPLTLSLSSEPGASIFYSLEALDRPFSGFRAYDPEKQLQIDRPRDGTRSWTLSAYAVDSAGNPGPVLTARYSVEPDPSGVEAAKGTDRTPIADGSPVAYSVDAPAPGTVRIEFKAGEASNVFAAVDPADPRDAAWYTEIPVFAGTASMELSAPVGWTGPLRVRCAVMENGTMLLSPDSVEIPFSYEDPSVPPPTPPEPHVLTSPGSRATLLSWDPFPFRIEVSVGESNFVPYIAPISVAVPEGGAGLLVRYRSVGPNGAASKTLSMTLAPGLRIGLPEITGLPENGLTNDNVRPRAPLGAVVRYEISDKGRPPSVTSASPLLDDTVVFPGEPNKETRYTLRVRAFSDLTPEAEGSDERFFTFSVDRMPPAPPTLTAGSLDGETEEDRIVAFEPGEGKVRFAVSEKGSPEEPVFRDYEGPKVLEGSGDRPVSYEVYAYAVDAAGNRSETIGPVSVRIDRASVYVASWGSDSAGGGPRNPLATLSAGVSAAARAGKRFVRVRGDVSLGSALRPTEAVEILGGCDESWEPSQGVRSRVTTSGISGPLFFVSGTELALRHLSISEKSEKDAVFAEIVDGTLDATDLELNLEAGGELTVIRAQNAAILFENSLLSLSESLFARIVDARKGTTRVRGLVVRTDTDVGYLTGFSAQGGTLEISGLRSETRTSGGFTLVRGTNAQTDVRDSYIREEGSGYCEIFRFEGGKAAVYLISSDIDCDGPLVFASLSKAQGDILHSTVSLSSDRSVFLDMDDSQVRLGNSVVSDRSGEGTLIRTNAALRRGTVVRNALEGFRAYIDGASPAVTVEGLNLIAAPPDGGNFEETFDRSDRRGYTGLPVLPPVSKGRTGAYPLVIPPPPDDLKSAAGAARRDVGAFEVSP